jgi:hypothetical protein
MAPTATSGLDPKVEAWLREQPKDLRDTCRAAAEALVEALPGAKVAIKWKVPTWVGNGNVVSVMAFTAHANLQFFRGAELPDPDGLLEGSGTGMRHVRLLHTKDLKRPAVKALVRAAWRLDQAGP